MANQELDCNTVVGASVIGQAILLESAGKGKGGACVDYQRDIASVAVWDGVKPH